MVSLSHSSKENVRGVPTPPAFALSIFFFFHLSSLLFFRHVILNMVRCGTILWKLLTA